MDRTGDACIKSSKSNSESQNTCIHLYMNNTKAEKDLFDKMNNCVWHGGGTREE